jgi:hypothetical protein
MMNYNISLEGFPVEGFETYAQARRHFDSVKPWRGKDDKPIGKRRHNTKRMRMLGDGTIVYRHHGTDVLRWHPNDTLTVNGYGSMTTTCLINRLLPSGIRHSGSNQVEPILMLYDAHGSDGPWGRWERYRKPDMSWDSYRRVPPVNPTEVVLCAHGVRLKFDKASDRWRPVSRLVPFEWRVPSKRSRAIAKRLDQSEFIDVSNALLALNEPEHKWYGYVDYRCLARLVMAKRYAEALEICPLTWEHTYDQITRKSGRTCKGVSKYALKRIRDRFLSETRGGTRRRSERILTLPQYRTYRDYLRRFGA